MMIVVNKNRLKKFAQDVLGCGCPENVFDRMDVQSLSNDLASSDAWKAIIGDRLLIHFREVEDVSLLK